MSTNLGSGWQPNHLSTLVIDLDADKIAGNDGDLVASWVNQAPTGSTLNHQAAGALRPTLKRAIINGRSTVLFDGAATVMWTAGQIAQGAYSEYVVFKTVTNPGSGTGAAISVTSDLGGTWDLISLLNVGGYQPFTFLGKVGTSNVTSSGIADALDTSPHILAVRYNGGTNTSQASYKCSLDGTSKTVVASGAAAENATMQTSVGGRRIAAGSTDSFWNGHLARHLIFTGSLADTDDAAVVKYLRNIYGI